jgi:hypothetical protein
MNLLTQFSDGITILPLSRNISILLVISASISTCVSIDNISSMRMTAGIPRMVSFIGFDSHGNRADMSSIIVGVRVAKVTSKLLISNSIFYSSGTSSGTADVSTMIYSSGNNSLSTIQGKPGMCAPFKFLPFDVALMTSLKFSFRWSFVNLLSDSFFSNV